MVKSRESFELTSVSGVELVEEINCFVGVRGDEEVGHEVAEGLRSLSFGEIVSLLLILENGLVDSLESLSSCQVVLLMDVVSDGEFMVLDLEIGD